MSNPECDSLFFGIDKIIGNSRIKNGLIQQKYKTIKNSNILEPQNLRISDPQDFSPLAPQKKNPTSFSRHFRNAFYRHFQEILALL